MYAFMCVRVASIPWALPPLLNKRRASSLCMYDHQYMLMHIYTHMCMHTYACGCSGTSLEEKCELAADVRVHAHMHAHACMYVAACMWLQWHLAEEKRELHRQCLPRYLLES